MGNITLVRFARILDSKEYPYRKANGYEDMFKHIDIFYRDKEKMEHSVDVKSAKKLHRSHSNTQPNLLLLELRGVRANGSSWLYDGQAELIAFDCNTDFYLFQRTALVTYIKPREKKIRDDRGVELSTRDNTINRIYARPSRTDEFIYVELQDVLDNIEDEKVMAWPIN
jgi:hypothetical protein